MLEQSSSITPHQPMAKNAPDQQGSGGVQESNLIQLNIVIADWIIIACRHKGCGYMKPLGLENN